MTAAQITSYTTALNLSESLTLNVPQAGDFLRIKASATNKEAYSTSSDLYLTSSNTQSDVNDSAYKDNRVGFVEGAANDNTTIFYYDGSYLTGFANGLQPVNNNDNQLKIGTAGASATQITFESIESTEAKAFRIEFNNGGRSLYTKSDSGDYFTDAAGGNATDPHYRYFLEKVTTLPVTITKYGMRTFSAPVALTIPNGVHAYTVSISGNDVTLEEVETTIPANTPVILYNHDVEWDGDAVAGSSQTYDFAIDKENTENALKCELSRIFVTKAKETNDLTLQYDLINKVFGFWKASGENINGFSAYLEWNDSYSNVRRFVITTPSTGIESVQETPMLDKNIYDVQGRRVGKASKGLYIINGKKVIL